MPKSFHLQQRAAFHFFNDRDHVGEPPTIFPLNEIASTGKASAKVSLFAYRVFFASRLQRSAAIGKRASFVHAEDRRILIDNGEGALKNGRGRPPVLRTSTTSFVPAESAGEKDETPRWQAPRKAVDRLIGIANAKKIFPSSPASNARIFI